MEKVLISNLERTPNLIISGTRYGNVMGSRGSVIPLFKSQVENNQPITITDPEMTRFMMSLDDAVNLVLYAFEHAKTGEIFIQKAPAAKLVILHRLFLRLWNHQITQKISLELVMERNYMRCCLAERKWQLHLFR